MPPILAREVWRDYVADGVPSSGPAKPVKSDIRQWGTWIESIISAFTSNGGLIYTSKAQMDADLLHGAKSSAWVIGDPVVANNGIYQKQLGSGLGSWTRVSDLPYSFIIASDVGAGTANAIQATTSIPVSSSALVWMNIFEANTASPVTVSFNGETALTIKTNSGNDVAANGLTAGSIVMGIVSGSTFRLISDQASASIVAAAEAAKVAAEAAQADAETAQIAAEAAGAAAEAAAAGVDLPPVTADTMLVDNAAGSARETKTFEDVRELLGLGDFAGSVIDAIPNYDPTASATRVLINGATENGGSPIYHRHFGSIETDNIGRVHVAYRRALGHATYFEGGIYEVVVEHSGQQRSAERQLVAPVAGWDISDPRFLLLPDGNLLLVWQELHIASPGLADQAVFKAKVSRDNGETYSAPWTLYTSGDGYCRLFGQLQLIHDYGAGGRWRIAFAAYMRVFFPSATLHTAIFYSEDGGLTFAEGTPIYSGALQYNETAVAWVNSSIGMAVMRVTPSDGFWGSRTLDGGATWSAPVKMTAFETAAVAPSLNIVTKNGIQYFLLGYCDRTADLTKWRWDSVSRALGSIAAAFTTNARITSTADMIEASGYQAVKMFPSGQMLFAEFKEYAYGGGGITDPVGTDVRLTYATPLGWVAGEESFTPTIVGATTPGAALGSFTGSIKKDDTGLVTGNLRIALTSKGGMVGQLKIGLPYAAKAGTRFRSGAYVTLFSNVILPLYGKPMGFIAAGSSTIDLYRSSNTATDTTGTANLADTHVLDTMVMEMTFQYFTDI